MAKKRNKKYNPKKLIQQNVHLNDNYIVYAVDSLALGVLNKKGEDVGVGTLAYNTLQHSVCERNACIGVIYKNGEEKQLCQREISLSRCTGQEAMKYVNDMTKEDCFEVGLENVLGRYYFITSDMNWEWNDLFIYNVIKRSGALEKLATPAEYIESEIIKMGENMSKFDPINSQVGGNHYSKMKIQPIEIIKGLRLSWKLGNAFKYVSRYKNKNGQQDLAKAFDYVNRELYDGYDKFYRTNPSISAEETSTFRTQFEDADVAIILYEIELIHRKRWRRNSKEDSENWQARLSSLLYSINELCKKEYGVNAY